MRLQEVVETSDLVRSSSGRLGKVALLADCLRRARPSEIRSTVALLTGVPQQGRIGIGWASLRGARSVTPAGRSTLTVADLDRALSRVRAVRGEGAAAERQRRLEALFGQATRSEQAFIARFLLGELRQGALEGVMVDAVAQAAGLPAEDVRRALMMAGDLGAVAEAAIGGGSAAIGRFSAQVFRPLKPMLASPAEDMAAALARLGRAALEWKLDGARIQLHKSGDEVRVYSRRLNDVTTAVPELVEQARMLSARELILDGEVLALRPDGRPHPFQVTMRRFGRKLEVERMRHELPLTPFFFDCLELDGKALVDRAAEERIGALSSAVPEQLRVPLLVTDRNDAAEAFAADALARGHEGVMAKALDASYRAGARGRGWLKVKPSHTLDLVVLAAEWGHGRRRGWLSNLHLGARDPAAGAFVMLGKTFKGLTDEMLGWQTEQLLAREIARDRYVVFVRPELVAEIAFAELQASPHYPGGLALRFARVKRYRPDKRAEDADTIDTVRAIAGDQAGGRSPNSEVSS